MFLFYCDLAAVASTGRAEVFSHNSKGPKCPNMEYVRFLYLKDRSYSSGQILFLEVVGPLVQWNAGKAQRSAVLRFMFLLACSLRPLLPPSDI